MQAESFQLTDFEFRILMENLENILECIHSSPLNVIYNTFLQKNPFEILFRTWDVIL